MPAAGPQFIDALTPLCNPFSESCAKGAVKHVWGPLWWTTWRRLTVDAGFQP
jgi:hypothetical protein